MLRPLSNQPSFAIGKIQGLFSSIRRALRHGREQGTLSSFSLGAVLLNSIRKGKSISKLSKVNAHEGAAYAFWATGLNFDARDHKVTLLCVAQIHAIMGQYFKANAAMMFMLKTIGCDSSQMFCIPQVLKINCFLLHTRDGDYQGET